MTTTTKSIATLIAVAAIVATLSSQSQAGCHGHGGGGFSISVGRSSSYNHYQPRYQTYHKPVYVAPPQPVQSFPQQPISQPGAPIGQPQQGQPFGQPQQAQQGQPFGQPQQPIQQGQPQQQAQQQQAPQQQPAAQPQQAPVSAETSALEALGGFAPPQQNEETKPAGDISQLPAHVGRWSATLTNGARIQLDLNANGSFNWSAVNKQGSTSSFQGTYEINSGSLVLIRSTDNQKLSGSLQTNGSNAFSFQLADQKAAKLEFVRA
ncbi:hypothetical protein [Blastopirellula marina]|uniref:Uncharacterized protein n=1 Tax=Blastopirellula marina TaxID=124 RepID=A0A2S8GIV1_9BACT|nr:hypothetical protein [Blastopirellula marina]PQO44251.1 hypothetical protein C5Y93_20015 [Blastopirellula marina]